MIMNGQYLLLFGALMLVLGVAIGDDADTTPLLGDTEADKVVKTLISPGGEIYDLFMEMLNATYGYLLFQKDVWEDFENDQDIFEMNMGKIRTMISRSNSSVKSMLFDVYKAAWYQPDKRWKLEDDAGQIAYDLKFGILKVFQDFDIPDSFTNYDEKIYKTLLDLRHEMRIYYCGCIHKGSHKILYEEMKSLEKRAIGYSVIIQETRRRYRKGRANKALRLAGRKAILAARYAREFNYRLLKSRLPHLVTNMITKVKKVVGSMRQLWKKYKIGVDTDIDFSLFYIKRPKDGVTRSPYNIPELQEAVKDVPMSPKNLAWEKLFFRGYQFYMVPPPTFD